MPAYLMTRKGNRDFACLLDTGCEVCLFSKQAVRCVEVEPIDQRLHAASGTNISLFGRISIQVLAISETFIVSCLASVHANEVIL